MIQYLIDEYSAAGEINVVQALITVRPNLEKRLEDASFDYIIKTYYYHNGNTHLISNRFLQPSPLLQLLALSNALYIHFDSPGSEFDGLKKSLLKVMDGLAERLVIASAHQLSVLFEALRKAISIVSRSEKKIILLELPLGNSIPCQMLGKLLFEKNVPFEVITISLNRNDATSTGITRKDLLKQSLAAKTDSMVIYIDEWISGSNFNTINDQLSKIKEIKVLPIALLSNDAEKNARFQTYVKNHDSGAILSMKTGRK